MMAMSDLTCVGQGSDAGFELRLKLSMAMLHISHRGLHFNNAICMQFSTSVPLAVFGVGRPRLKDCMCL